MQRIIWTVLPNGIRDGKRRLSVLVSPRLEGVGGSTLESFQDFVHWRAKLLSFGLTFEPPAGPAVPAVAAPAQATADEQALWAALFDEETPVQGHVPKDYSTLLVHSYPMQNVLSYLKGTYQALASNPATATHFPAVEALLGPGGLQEIAFPWELFGDPPDLSARPRAEEPEASKRLSGLIGGRRKAVSPAAPDPALDFWQLKVFLRSDNATKPVTNSKTGLNTIEHVPFFPKPLPKPELDFHQALALLGEHPALMRALGLVIDLEVDDRRDLPKTGRVSIEEVDVSPGWQVQTIPVFPKTRYTTGFMAEPKTSELTGGQLNLALGEYGLVDVDVEGAALKLMNLADTVLRSLLAKNKTADRRREFSLPALRSAGLGVVRAGRAVELVSTLEKATGLNKDAVGAAPKQSELFADDLARGYRVDVSEGVPGGPWRSLCRRQVRYLVEGKAAQWPPASEPDVEDEGWTSLAATSAPDRSAKPDLFLSEALLRWEGWSLCARRPGQHVGTDDTAEQFEGEADNELGLRIVNSATGPGPRALPGSLPLLRYGRSYRVRARAVDLAGNSLPHDHAGTSPALGPTRHCRFEPVPTPTVVWREKPHEGESLEHLVIRSFNAAPADDVVPTSQTCDRHLAPPLASQLLAEAHGKFDAHDPARLVRAHRRRGRGPTTSIRTHSALSLHPEPQLGLPYLPDPLARGAAFLGLPGEGAAAFLGLPGAPLNKQTEFHADGTVTVTDLSPTEKPPITLVQVDFGPDSEWPDARPFRLRLVEGNGEPAWDEQARELTVQAPKAEIARVRLSSYLDADALPVLGIWRWIEEKKPAVTAKVKERLTRLAIQGRHWMLTPFRELVVVHAVQQPLVTPDISKLTVARGLGSKGAILNDDVSVHAKSTAKLDLVATWSENVDPVGEPKWRTLTGSAHAFDVPIAYPGLPSKPADDVAALGRVHRFGDTKHRDVTYRAVATSRFREYFEPGLELTRTSPAVHGSGSELGPPGGAQAPLRRADVRLGAEAHPGRRRHEHTLRWRASSLPRASLVLIRGRRAPRDRPSRPAEAPARTPSRSLPRGARPAQAVRDAVGGRPDLGLERPPATARPGRLSAGERLARRAYARGARRLRADGGRGGPSGRVRRGAPPLVRGRRHRPGPGVLPLRPPRHRPLPAELGRGAASHGGGDSQRPPLARGPGRLRPACPRPLGHDHFSCSEQG